ncbi:uncharacterized protein LOC100278185 [Zea mays]|uniref:Uncharacterized protein n=1 Tax=Zea mays TaxID=4577 RepID=B6U521_MAIZE|nr:uncharacterized protein LOC100278185 [Zea mays]ACG44454.1 hypothetical protein [Zea mays]|eukprot:NP_001145015.1 uncharacterized protein LOC100278185 [Zea mays]
MDFFPDRAFVRLRNRAYGTYLYADDDGAGVILKPQRGSLQTAWQVHRVWRHDRIYILLHSAAYGRYLAVSRVTMWVDTRHHANLTVQGVYETPEQDDVLWEAAYVDNVHVVMLQASHRLLRASTQNTTFFRYVFVDHPGHYYGTMMHWTVESIPARPLPCPSAFPIPVPTDQNATSARMILYRRADDYGNVNPLSRRRCKFFGYSLLRLRAHLASLLKEPIHRITLCVRAGSQGRPTPLVIDLPSNHQNMEIIVLTTLSPAALALCHPDVDAQ